MNVLNCWSLSSELSVHLFGFYLWMTVCPVSMPVFHYFSHLICMYTYLILIIWCNVMWAFFVLHFADVLSCCHMYVLYIPAAFLLVSCMWLPFSVTSHPLSIFMSLLLLLLLLCLSSLLFFFALLCFVLLFLSYLTVCLLFWEGNREVLCVVLWCVSLLVGVASYVGINLLSLFNKTYWCYFVSLQQPYLVLCSWIWLHWSLSVVSPGEPLMMNQMVWICWLYFNKPQQI